MQVDIEAQLHGVVGSLRISTYTHTHGATARRRASSRSTRRVSSAHKRYASNHAITLICVAIYTCELAYLHERESEDGILQRLLLFRLFGRRGRLNDLAKRVIKHLDLQWLGQDQGTP